jgi:hypothetical protein
VQRNKNLLFFEHNNNLRTINAKKCFEFNQTPSRIQSPSTANSGLFLSKVRAGAQICAVIKCKIRDVSIGEGIAGQARNDEPL